MKTSAEKNMEQVEENSRLFNIWQLQDNLGKKNLAKSIEICISSPITQF